MEPAANWRVHLAGPGVEVTAVDRVHEVDGAEAASDRAPVAGVPNVLLVTASPPGNAGVGQIIVTEIVRHLPAGSVSLFALLRAGETWSPSAEFCHLPVARAVRKYEHGFHRGPRGLREAGSWLAFQGLYLPHVRRLKQEVVDMARRQKVDSLCIILESATLIDLARELVADGEFPVYPLVWDTPEHLHNYQHQCPFNLSSLEAAFGHVMRAVPRAAVVSSEMAATYRRQFDTECVIVRHSVESAQTNHTAMCQEAEHREGPLTIGFAGSATAPIELELLFATLDDLDWSLNGRDIEVHLFGPRFVLQSSRPRRIVYRGNHSVSSTVSLLARDCDILFMPQIFAPEHRTLATMSFQTKFSTYLAARKPVLLLAPEGSTVGIFLQAHPVGVWCQQLDRTDMRNALVAICGDEFAPASIAGVLDRVLTDEFSTATFRRRLGEFLALVPSKKSTKVAGRHS